jgi:demethylmenaquinone methyltransferase / 2-methoxy-6-polyprenyl-1,4-benzoquinol methylase
MDEKVGVTTDFGFEQVSPAQKTQRVGEVFSSVAKKYDLMNDLMSFGIHRLWKKMTIALTSPRPGQSFLDIAGGTGDLAARLAKRHGKNSHIVLTDINPDMLNVGRQRLLDQGLLENISFVLADAEKLPFPDQSFDCITIAFGLRNVTDKMAALRSMRRCLKPGGQAFILEFSKPAVPGLQTLYDLYSFKILPRLGKWIAKDAESYRYLVESIRMHPDQQTLKQWIFDAGFDHCQYQNFSGGIVALHRASVY